MTALAWLLTSLGLRNYPLHKDNHVSTLRHTGRRWPETFKALTFSPNDIVSSAFPILYCDSHSSVRAVGKP